MADARAVLNALSSGGLPIGEAVAALMHECEGGEPAVWESQLRLIDRFAADGLLQPQTARDLRNALVNASRALDPTRRRVTDADETSIRQAQTLVPASEDRDETRSRPTGAIESHADPEPTAVRRVAGNVTDVRHVDLAETIWREDRHDGPQVIESSIRQEFARPLEDRGPGIQPQQGDVVHEWYRLESPLGAGAMGQVWMATDLQRLRAGDPQPRVALKLVGADFARNRHAMVAMQREASKAQQLAHPNIATVFVFAEDPRTGQGYLAMELLVGQPLDRMLRQQSGGVAHDQAMEIVRGLASGLAYAHAKGVVHCDFKPGNAFVTEAGVAKVLDFGIARLAKQLARAGDTFDAGVLGALTPAYASLEMLRGDDPDPADDVYALGLVAYEVLSGRHPFGRASADDARARRLRATPLEGVRRREWRAIERALRFERSERWPDAQAFLKALEGTSLWIPALGGLAATLALVAGYVAYQNYVESLPKIPFEQLPADAQGNFRSAMQAGDYAYRFATTEAQGAEAVQAIYRDALSEYATAYALHPRNAEADAALQRSLDYLGEHLPAQTPAVRGEARVVLDGYREQYQELAKYGPLEDLLAQLAE
jgi:serine/threonine protein kinase